MKSNGCFGLSFGADHASKLSLFDAHQAPGLNERSVVLAVTF